MLILSPPASLPSSLNSLIANNFSITCHEPDALLSTLKSDNESWLHPTRDSIPQLTHLHAPLISTSSQRVELTPSLLPFANSDLCPQGPISMLNLVSFRPFKSARESYGNYIETTKAGIGAKHGLVVNYGVRVGREKKRWKVREYGLSRSGKKWCWRGIPVLSILRICLRIRNIRMLI